MAVQRPVYQALASKVDARANCERTGNQEWFDRHGESIEALVQQHLPSGSGFDSGTELDLHESKPERLVFNTAFHHMDDAGMYDGWTYHSVVVTPSLVWNYNLRVTGRDKRDIKEYISQAFRDALDTITEE